MLFGSAQLEGLTGIMFKMKRSLLFQAKLLSATGSGEERRLGPCDFAFFPAGSTATWRVPELVRKVAVVRETLWMPLGFSLKAWKKLLRMAGLSDTAPLR